MSIPHSVRGMTALGVTAAFTLITWTLPKVVTVAAQGAASTATPSYSAGQAERGEMLYAKSCASCHAADLSGSATVPPLKGPEFESYWLGKPVGELFEKIGTTMPKNQPKSLMPDQNAELVAHILRELGAPAGPTDLGSSVDALNKITIAKAE